jgi:hypothetical protein
MITNDTHRKPVKYSVAEESKKRDMRLPKDMSQPNENPPQVSIILCMRLFVDITTLHMKLKRRDHKRVDILLVLPRLAFYETR